MLLLGLIGMLLGPLLAWTAAASLGPRALGLEGVRLPIPARVGRGLLGWIEIPEREATHRGRPRARGGPPGDRSGPGLFGPPRRPPSTRPDAGPTRPAPPQRTR